MKLVIDIDEKDYELYKNDDWNIPKVLRDTLENGTPLEEYCDVCPFQPTESEDD